ncbi:DUF4357 domain-containing protein [Streptomyces sp. NPDC059479]|uniref:DUF4357 domain-containing protein n=1 Tax=Streptomyces sp. NPDC059479 TaxID=3346848 RepID=UPI0036B3C141
MPTFVLHVPTEALNSLAAAGADGTVELTLQVGIKPTSAPAEASHPTGPLAPLLRAGILPSGTRLHFRQPRAKRSATATVQRDGTLLVDGRATAYRSPSKAASAITGSQINGWTLWHLDNGRTLDDLRNTLEQNDE